MRGRVRTIVQWVVVLGGAGVMVWQLPALARETTDLGAELAQLRWGWVGAAVLLGIGALVAYGELHRRLLAAGGARLPVRTIQAINFAQNALSTTLPAVGNAVGFVYATYQLRKRKVDVALAAWSLVLAGTVATITLIVLGVLGLGWAGKVPVLVAVGLAAGVVLGSWACWILVNRPSVLHRGLRGLTWLTRRLPGFCRTCRRTWATDPDATARRISERIRLLRPDRGQWAAITALAALSWLLDYLSLTTSVTALGSPVPWSTLVVGFLVVQGSIALQVFPGGAGLAEAGLLGVLTASGVPIAPALASVLVYRLINWLGLAALGWLVYAVQIHLAPVHEHQHAPELAATGPGAAKRPAGHRWLGLAGGKRKAAPDNP
ncbi:flippase-like domain-containing protein [Saccharopolyspora sp. K220]|uniref:lysylphosphatidylglycerol synthase transmembrane domain-containing protein n=1 Tax=Saccharopolyspora soli TaxID=2926618 RepID=UPI001F59892F|nr:lysylphosphatidylglycerol synthase transmembrane domain-containing protein [Saccharopolyspora soli]MCI2417975.1 flippase-like domain-containing protein [Saccharopolyspora soli]